MSGVQYRSNSALRKESSGSRLLQVSVTFYLELKRYLHIYQPAVPHQLREKHRSSCSVTFDTSFFCIMKTVQFSSKSSVKLLHLTYVKLTKNLYIMEHGTVKKTHCFCVFSKRFLMWLQLLLVMLCYCWNVNCFFKGPIVTVHTNTSSTWVKQKLWLRERFMGQHHINHYGVSDIKPWYDPNGGSCLLLWRIPQREAQTVFVSR